MTPTPTGSNARLSSPPDGGAKAPPARRWLVLAVFIALAVALGYAARDSLGFETLAARRADLQGAVKANGPLSAALFIVIYATTVVFSIPGAVWLTLAGGLMFGVVWGAVYVVGAATLGATGVFVLARYVFREAWSAKAGESLKKMEAGFRHNAFSYMLALRLAPVFPFWLVNLAPALLGVSTPTYVLATALGIIPGSVVYAALGAGLGDILDQGGTPDLGVIWEPAVIGPLLGLAALALVPVLWRAWRARRPKSAGEAL